MKSLLSVIAEVGGAGAITPAAFGLFSRALPPWDPPPRTPEQDRDVLIDALAELAEHAAAEGVEIWLEPLNRYEDHMINRLEQAADICRIVGRPVLKVMADTFHMNIEEDDPAVAIRAVGELIGHVQLGDSARFQPGTGHVDFAAEFAALKEVGFDGWAAMECAIRGDPRDALPEVARLLRPML
jgi:sugar phosphate isomerase/epimerase